MLAIVLELGVRAGARLARELGLLVGRDALLARAKRATPAKTRDRSNIYREALAKSASETPQVADR